MIGSEPRCEDGSSIEALLLDFVKTKAARSQSQKTAKAYFETMTAFRAYLQERGLDLILYTRDEPGWTDYPVEEAGEAACSRVYPRSTACYSLQFLPVRRYSAQSSLF